MSICQSPWSRRRLLSHQGKGALGSSEGLVKRSMACPISVQAGSQQGPHTMVYWKTSAATGGGHSLWQESQELPHAFTRAPPPQKKVTAALSSACSHTHPPTYSESCDRTSRVACSSPQTRLPTGPRAGEPAAVESRAGPVAQHQRTGLTVSSLGSQTSSGGNLGSAL